MKKMWTSIKKGLDKAWQKLDNNKTWIGGAIWAAAYVAKYVKPDLMPGSVFELTENVGLGIMGVGSIHKVGKIVMHKQQTKDDWKKSFKAGFKKEKGNSAINK